MNISYYQKLLICALATTISLLSVEREGKQIGSNEQQYCLAIWSSDQTTLERQLKEDVIKGSLHQRDHTYTDYEIIYCAKALQAIAPRILPFHKYGEETHRVTNAILQALAAQYDRSLGRMYHDLPRGGVHVYRNFSDGEKNRIAITSLISIALEKLYTSPVFLPSCIAHLKACMEYRLPRYPPLYHELAYNQWFASAPVTKAYRADEVPALPHLSSSFTWPKRIQEDDQEGLS